MKEPGEAIKIIKRLITSIERVYKSNPLTEKESHPATDALIFAVSTLEKQEWHNARKDPPKRPNNMWDNYLVATNFGRYGIARYYVDGKWLGYDEDGDQIEDDEIAVYCDLPDRYDVEANNDAD